MTRQFAKIIDHPALVRDMGTQAILNTDMTSVRRHQKRQIEMEKEEARILEINSLKNELAELKSMIRTLISKK